MLEIDDIYVRYTSHSKAVDVLMGWCAASVLLAFSSRAPSPAQRCAPTLFHLVNLQGKRPSPAPIRDKSEGKMWPGLINPLAFSDLPVSTCSGRSTRALKAHQEMTGQAVLAPGPQRFIIQSYVFSLIQSMIYIFHALTVSNPGPL